MKRGASNFEEGRSSWICVELDRVCEHLFGDLDASEQMCMSGTTCEDEMHEIICASLLFLVGNGACHCMSGTKERILQYLNNLCPAAVARLYGELLFSCSVGILIGCALQARKVPE